MYPAVVGGHPTDTMGSVTVLYAGELPDGEAFLPSATVVRAPDVATATDRFTPRDVDCVVSAYDLPDGTGFDLFESVRAAAPDVPCVLWTDRPADVPTGPDLPVVESVDRAAGVDALADVVETAVETRSHAAYPLPPDEDARLDAVERYPVDALLDDRTLDRLAGLAAEHVGAPVSVVGLVGAHEQRFVVCRGADWPPIHRQDAVCTYTVLGGAPLAVEDVREDPRFRSNGVLADLGVRSYLGAPLVAPGDHAVGTLCVCDHRPRRFTDDARAALEQFAAEAMEQLELRRRLGEWDGT